MVHTQQYRCAAGRFEHLVLALDTSKQPSPGSSTLTSQLVSVRAVPSPTVLQGHACQPFCAVLCCAELCCAVLVHLCLRSIFIHCAVAVPAYHLRRPVKAILDRDEDMQMTGDRMTPFSLLCDMTLPASRVRCSISRSAVHDVSEHEEAAWTAGVPRQLSQVKAAHMHVI